MVGLKSPRWESISKCSAGLTYLKYSVLTWRGYTILLDEKFPLQKSMEKQMLKFSGDTADIEKGVSLYGASGSKSCEPSHAINLSKQIRTSQRITRIVIKPLDEIGRQQTAVWHS